MLNLFKKIFGSKSRPPEESKQPALPPIHATLKPKVTPQTTSAPKLETSHENVNLNLRFIIQHLPQELKTSILRQPDTQTTVLYSKNQLLKQLSTGSFRITFQDLRTLAPMGTFKESGEFDLIEIQVPIQGIIQQLGPQFFSPRKDQKKVEVPDDVQPVFGNRGGFAAQKPSPPNVEEKSEEPVAPPPPPPPAAPSTNAGSQATIKMSPNFSRPGGADTPLKTPISPIAPDPVPSEPKQVEQIPAVPTTEGPCLEFTIQSLMPVWPEKLTNAVQSLSLVETRVSLPLELLESGLKRGRIAVPWNQFKSFLPTSVPSDTLSDLEIIELPLAIVAPEFLKFHKPQTPQKSVEIDEAIPGLFAAKTSSIKPSPPSEPAVPEEKTPEPIAPSLESKPNIYPQTSQKNADLRGDSPLPSQELPAKTKPSPYGAFFNDPERTDWVPSDIVTYLSTWTGISSAMIASSDGLVISEWTDEGVNAENLVALVVQSYRHLEKLKSELKQGHKTGMSIAFGAIQIWVREAGASYLIVAGPAGSKIEVEKLEELSDLLAKNPI